MVPQRMLRNKAGGQAVCPLSEVSEHGLGGVDRMSLLRLWRQSGRETPGLGLLSYELDGTRRLRALSL